MGDPLYLDLILELVPFFNIFREDMESNINSVAEDLEKICRENPNVEIIHTGSAVEGLSLPHLESQTWNTDADHMLIRTNIKIADGVKKGESEIDARSKTEQGSMQRALEPGPASAEKEHDLFYIYDASHKGYALLSSNKLSLPLEFRHVEEYCLQNSKFIESSQNVVPLRGFSLFSAFDQGSITGPSYSLPCNIGSFNVNRDFVYGVKCPFWPSQAEEWLHRARPNWPTDEVISSIAAQGCHVVPVGSHNSNLREYEWRFSFSVAELTLVRSLSKKQKMTYSLLKAVIKSELKLREIDVFASYHLKTCLLWFLEKNGTRSWGEHSLGTSILELIDFLIEFYAHGSLPNYFISTNNMIDHRSSEDILKLCHALQQVRDTITLSFCRYIESNQSLPVSFDAPLSHFLQENTRKFAENCKYNFLVMALAYILKKEKSRIVSSELNVEARSLIKKALVLHQANQSKEETANLQLAIAKDAEVSHFVDELAANVVLSLLDQYLASDGLKVTESSAVALAVFNVFLSLHPIPPLEPNEHVICSPAIKETLMWACRIHEIHSNAIYDFVTANWKNGPHLFTDDEEAKKFMKLLMVILGMPTKQARSVTGALVKRKIEGQRFLIMRGLAHYLLHVHLESAYVAFQAAAYLMANSAFSEIYNLVQWSTHEPTKCHAIELILSKPELQTELSEEEFDRLIHIRHESTELR